MRLASTGQVWRNFRPFFGPEACDPVRRLITISCLCWGVKAEGRQGIAGRQQHKEVLLRSGPREVPADGSLLFTRPPASRAMRPPPVIAATATPGHSIPSGKDCHEVREEEAGVRRDRTHDRDPCPHHLLVRPADAGRRARTARQLLGLQERTGPRAAPALPAAARQPAAARTVADGPVHPRALHRRAPATSSPSAGCTTATSTSSTASPRANIRLAAHVAKRFRHHALSYADLLQEAVCGLMQAIDRFDVSHGTRLATYATWWIRQTLQIAVARQSHLVSLSPAPPAGTRPAPAGDRGPGPRRQAPAQPAGTGQPHRQQPRTPDPPADRHPHPGQPERRPRRRQRLQADRGDAGQHQHADDAGRTTSGRRRSAS